MPESVVTNLVSDDDDSLTDTASDILKMKFVINLLRFFSL